MKKKQVRWVDVPENENERKENLERRIAEIKGEEYIPAPNNQDNEGWEDVDENDIPYFKSSDKLTRPAKQAKRENIASDNEYFTGEKNKKLLVHILQNGVEVTRPLKKRIYDQQVFWRKRTWAIDIKRTIVDAKGIHHMYVSANDMAILTFNKDHADTCHKCGGKMFIDARNARDMVKRNTIQAIWGIDSTHMILLLIFAVGAMAMAGFAFYSYNQDTRHTAELKAEQAKNAQLIIDNEILKNMTRSNPPVIINPPITNNPNEPDTTEPPSTIIRPSDGSSPIPEDNFEDNDLIYNAT